jgi:hypothetical protein
MFLAMGHSGWPITKKEKLKLWVVPKIEIPLEDGVPFLWPTHIGEKMTTLGKTYCIKNVVLLGTF